MLNKIIQVFSFSFFLLAIWLITGEIHNIGLLKLEQIILSTPGWIIGLALMMTGVDFIALCGYDILGLRYIKKQVPMIKIAEASYIGFAVSNTVGHAFVSGGAVRYLLYSPAGLNKMEILKLIAFESLTIFMGMGIAFVLSVAIAPFEGILRTGSYLNILDIMAGITIIAFILYDFMIIRKKKDLHFGKITLSVPSQKMTLTQLFVGLADNFSAFLVFYIIFRSHLDVSVFETFSIFIIAQIIGLLTQVPGGLGVFESTFLYLYPHAEDEKSLLLTSLIMFRVIYYFIPFISACLYLIIRYIFQIRKQREKEN